MIGFILLVRAILCANGIGGKWEAEKAAPGLGWMVPFVAFCKVQDKGIGLQRGPGYGLGRTPWV